MRAAILLLTATLLAAPFAATAAEWALKPGDVPYDPAEIAVRIDGQTLRFYDGGRSEYGPQDAYAYVYSDETRVPGRYTIAEDASVCIAFDNGFSRCDLYVRNNGRD